MNDRRDRRDLDDTGATIVPEDRTPAADETLVRGSTFATLDPFATFSPGDGRDSRARPVSYVALARGDQIGDFRIQRLLGRGSFGAVYLARELTLDRLVAVKVVLPEGKRATSGEGRSLARLTHPNIVGVYGEAHDRVSGCSMLWMQFVDGSDLASLIQQLHQGHTGGDWSQADLLRLLTDNGRSSEYETKASGLRGSVETVCRIGQQLAEALSHAHHSGITHRDIKPANILMRRDGTPLLADFNLADNAHNDDERITGGTIAYMPPEQFAHCLRQGGDYDSRRADIYSLGVVLWELATGHRPFADAESKIESEGGRRLLEMLEIRRQEVPRRTDETHVGLCAVLQRAISVNPSDRYYSAGAMATALTGLAELQRARRRMPTIAGVSRLVRRYLLLIILIGGVLPHFAASIFQSAYNLIWIGTPGDAFTRAFLAYNVVVYPACVGWLAWSLYRFAQGYRRVVARQSVPRGQMRNLRRRLLRLPRQFMIASALGWFPGIVLFPWLLGLFGPPTSANHWFHYGISFTIAGLIATTYSYAFVLYVVVCHGYRSCWQSATHYRDRARYELSGMQQRIRRVSILVGVLPLAAAVLLLAIALPEMNHVSMMNMPKEQLMEAMSEHQAQMNEMNRLVTALIVLGAIGLYVVETASERLIRCVRELTLADEGS